MAWETRRGQRYFYEMRRVAGKVVKTYFGNGSEALEAERKVLDRKTCRTEGKAAIRDLGQALEPVDDTLTELDAAVTLLIQGSLLAAGYHQHSGTWRARRARKD